MRYVPKLVAAMLAVCLCNTTARAQEPIRLARTPAISPDGKLVAFSYLGDIWVVEAIGGVARPVTMHEAHDIGPVFSPDGRYIAFTSNRHGSYDVFVVPVHGGRPRRLTFDSAADHVNDWSPDGKTILFSTARTTAFPRSWELYTVPVEGGRERRVGLAEGRDGSFAPDGKQIAYVRGPGTWYRKGYRGSSNDDLWLCHLDGSNNRRLTEFNGQDYAPLWAADGKSLYFVSECCDTVANVMRLDLASARPAVPVTNHTEDGVRQARISRDGQWIVYECGADLWVTHTSDRSRGPRKLAIEVHADDKVNPERTLTLSGGASEFALSADEKHVAFVVHGELFVMPIEGGKATQLTHSPAYDHGVAWAPDAKKLVFASDRNGQEDLYLLEPDDPEHPELVKAHKFKVKQLTATPEPEYGVSFSPDGKRIAFIRSGKLWTMNPDGTGQKPLVNEVQVVDYEWSPERDSTRWVAFARADGHFASELYIMPTDGSAPPRNVTRYATYNAGVTWSPNGKKLAFVSERRRQTSMWVLSLQKPAAADAPASKDIDWDDIHLRVEQPAGIPAEEGAINLDGTRVAFRSSGSSGDDLWVASTSGGQLTRLTTGNVRPRQIQWSKRSADLIYFLDAAGAIRSTRASSGDFAALFGRASSGSASGAGSGGSIPFRVKLTMRRDEEFQEIFEQSWRALAEHFYDPKFHGVNWTAVRQKYRPLVQHVALKEDLYVLISLMLGELNASHLGIEGYAKTPEQTTADLGLLFDDAYRGPGLKIAEVLKRGPADRRGLQLKAGDILLAVDRTELTERVSLSQLLNDKVGEAVQLVVSSNPADPKDRRRVEVQASGRKEIADLMYERWVESNARRVADVSKGRLGYIHIPSMDEEGLDRFVRALYSDNFDKEAIVLDVRYNGGGFTHDQVLNYLGAREHTFFRQRDGGEGLVLRSYDRKWTKPVVLLINNRSYSDAEILPNAFRTLGLGKLVGQPTGGCVIGTSGVRLIDGSYFRIPRTGVFTVTGINMEKEGVMPDVLVEAHPDQLARGQDPQLDKAVEVLEQEVVAWKKTHPRLAGRSEEIKTAVAGPSPPTSGK